MVTHPNTEPPKVPKASKIHTQLVASLVNGEVFPIQITEKKVKIKPPHLGISPWPAGTTCQRSFRFPRDGGGRTLGSGSVT